MFVIFKFNSDCKRSKNITICPKNLIAPDSKENGMNRTSIKLIEEDKMNEPGYYNSKGEKVWKEFKVSNKLDLDEKDNEDSSLEWDEDNDDVITVENEEFSVKDVKPEKDEKEKIDSNFDIISPYIPAPNSMHKFTDYYQELESEGIDLNNCLIIKDKLAFIKFFDKITDKILHLMKE